jgi:hypothetical protein
MRSGHQSRQALPERHVNFLKQVPPAFGVRFIGAREALQRVAVLRNRALVEIADAARVAGDRCWLAHLEEFSR